MAGYDNDYDGLKSLIIRDQFFVTCDRQLQTFLKEKGKLSLKEMAKAANDFYEAHGYPSDSLTFKETKWKHETTHTEHCQSPKHTATSQYACRNPTL